jgi:oligopeptidase A
MASSSSSSTTTSSAATTDNDEVCLSQRNPLLQITGLPQFHSLVQVGEKSKVSTTGEEQKEEDGIVTYLTPAVTEALQTMEQKWKQLETSLATKLQQNVPILYDDVIPVLEQIQYPLSYVWGIASHLNGVRNSDGLRHVYETNQPLVVQSMSQFQQSTILYQALEQINNDNIMQQQHSSSSLSTAQQRAIELSIRSMKLGGVGLTKEEDKQKFNTMKQQLAQLSNTFSNHVLDATKAFSYIVTDKTKLTNVPPSALDLWSTSYKSYLQQQKQPDNAGDDGTTSSISTSTSEEGPWRITLDGPSYMAVLQHVPDRELRETVYRAYITRASEITTPTPPTTTTTESTATMTMTTSSPESETTKDDTTIDMNNNVPLIYEILQLRYDMAQMLGYPNYAEMSLASKMAPSITAITDLSQLILQTALPTAQQELHDITNYARQQGFTDDDDVLKPWDISFWSERYKESKFELTEEETRPYFALPAVLNGMFALVERIFNIQVVEVPPGEVEVWHTDVQYFKVYDVTKGKDKEEIAGFYLDPYSRPENKRGGAWMDVCIGKSEAVNHKIPVAYLTCNGSPPIPEKHQPSLMTFREVETLFHEFGHGLQHMLTTMTVGDVAGINGVEWDAVELPSQFMENWYVVFLWQNLCILLLFPTA